MEEGKGERYLASGRQYGNALLGVRHQEEDWYWYRQYFKEVLLTTLITAVLSHIFSGSICRISSVLSSCGALGHGRLATVGSRKSRRTY